MGARVRSRVYTGLSQRTDGKNNAAGSSGRIRKTWMPATDPKRK